MSRRLPNGLKAVILQFVFYRFELPQLPAGLRALCEPSAQGFNNVFGHPESGHTWTKFHGSDKGSCINISNNGRTATGDFSILDGWRDDDFEYPGSGIHTVRASTWIPSNAEASGTVKVLSCNEIEDIAVGIVTENYSKETSSPWDESIYRGNPRESCSWTLESDVVNSGFRWPFQLGTTESGDPLTRGPITCQRSGYCLNLAGIYRNLYWERPTKLDSERADRLVHLESLETPVWAESFPPCWDTDITVTVRICGGKLRFAYNGEQVGPLIPLPEGRRVALAVSLGNGSEVELLHP